MFIDQEITTAKFQDSLLHLETIHAYALTSKTIDTSAWHKRLGYINEEYMKKDSTQETVGDIRKFLCDICLNSKLTRNISRCPVIKSKRPLEKTHSDIAGLITPTTPAGNK